MTDLKVLKYTATLLWLLILVVSCEKNSEINLDDGKRYYPQEEGLYRIYQVTHININQDLQINDTTSYQIKELNDSSYIDQTDDEAMRLERYYRETIDDEWELLDVWVDRFPSQMVIRVAEDESIARMAMPPRLDTYWDINTFNTQEEWMAHYERLAETYTVDGSAYLNTVSVVLEDLSNLFLRKNGYRVYEKNVGMVYSETVEFTLSEPVDEEQDPVLSQIQSGYQIIYKIIANGVE